MLTRPRLTLLLRPDDPPGTTPPATPPATPPTSTFSQEDVDRIVQDRLARERAKTADYDDLKAKAGKLDELERAGQSEADRVRGDLARAQAERETAQRERDEARAELTDVRIRSAVVAAAAKAGAADADDVYALLPKAKVTVGDDGQVTGAEQAVTELLAAKPHLVGTTPPPGPGDGGIRTPAPVAGLDDQIAEAERKGDWQTVSALNLQKLAAVAGQQR